MNTKDPLPASTAKLLRAPLPDTEPRPGLETRLLAGIRDAPASPMFPWQPVLGGACALFLLAAVLVPLLTPGPAPTITDTPPAPERPTFEIAELPNPLEKEATALRSSATRAGRFLISCLPAIPDDEGPIRNQ